jgi:hypothetical protein
MSEARGLEVPKDSGRTVSSASTIAGDQVSDKAAYLSGGDDDKHDESLEKLEKQDEVASTAATEVPDEIEYPSGIKLLFIVVALVMSIFLLALDMVS